MELFSPEYFAFIRNGASQSAKEIVPLVCSIYQPQRVLDVACGTGEWLKVFREHGANEVLGLDAAWIEPSMLSINSEEFVTRDITKPLEIDAEFDMVLMLEAIQHVPERLADDMVQSLTRFAPYVLFSAPIPHQGGSGDCVNEQWPEYWARLFEAHGFVCIDLLRRLIWANERVEWWYAQNLLLFVSNQEMAKNELLYLAQEASPGPPLAMVHPRLFESRSEPPIPHRSRALERVGRVLQFSFRMH